MNTLKIPNEYMLNDLLLQLLKLYFTVQYAIGNISLYFFIKT